jgi:hypothetical protein
LMALIFSLSAASPEDTSLAPPSAPAPDITAAN